ncbi:MAG: metal-dependent transcriptional regulator [Endomicrobium sp.]|jgi:DtxR family Mn-dependent transcriptional regulator|nr:metal-dependent transcriptional regulator [Endomicrobium sp.]
MITIKTNVKNKRCFYNLSASLENYLETIAILKKRKRYARIGDIAKHLNVKSSSVNVAINFLLNKGFVIHEKYGYVDLTEYGEEIAVEIQLKHEVLYKFLNSLLLVNGKTADKEACKIEHSICVDTIKRLRRFHNFLENKFLKNNKNVVNLREHLEKTS